jgi:hypothetical protein
MENLQFLVTGQDNAPWTGYYATFNGAKMAVSNFLGIWFEIRRCEGEFKAFRVACSALQLKSHPLPGTNIVALMESSEPLPTTHPASRVESLISQPEEIEPMLYVGKGKETELEALLWRSKSSQTAQGDRPPRHPRGDGDDPYRLNDLTAAADEGKDKYIRLEGVLLESYEGDWAETQNFLMQFKRYILMNWGAEIAI